MQSTNYTPEDMRRFAANASVRGALVEKSPNGKRLVYALRFKLVEIQLDASNHVHTIGDERTLLQSMPDGTVVKHTL